MRLAMCYWAAPDFHLRRADPNRQLGFGAKLVFSSGFLGSTIFVWILKVDPELSVWVLEVDLGWKGKTAPNIIYVGQLVNAKHPKLVMVMALAQTTFGLVP